MSPVVGIIGSVQAMEAIKIISNLGKTLTGRLMLLDAFRSQWREMRLLKDPSCEACGSDKLNQT